jgi:hypothetical protein
MRAQDGVGNMSNWTTKKCTVIPLNSDQLGYSSGWYRSANAGEFAGFGHVTKTKGAKMTRTSIVAKKVSLVVTKCTSCGTVEVRWNGKVVKTVSLVASKTVHKQVVDVASFATAQTGTLTVTNTAPNGKSVVLEGVAVFNG